MRGYEIAISGHMQHKEAAPLTTRKAWGMENLLRYIHYRSATITFGFMFEIAISGHMQNKEAAAHHEEGLGDGEPPEVHPLQEGHQHLRLHVLLTDGVHAALTLLWIG
jgi:hypothetical protein